MPRDDLTIDFVKMPQIEPLDPSLILDDWMNRVQNLPEEIRFMEDEVADKDRQYNECIRMIEDRDGKIQKWIKSNGSHEPNPKEDILRSQIRDKYARADQLSLDKIALIQKLQAAMDKHLRSLDAQLKLLYDRAEPGFTEPDEIPSLLRPSAANHSAPSARAVNPSAAVTNSTSMPSPLGPAQGNFSNPATTRLPVHPSIRHAQAQQTQTPHSASAPTTPGAIIILNRQREKSSGPTLKRGPRSTTGLGAAPATSSALARHSSLGPGSGRGAAGAGAASEGRAGSAAPRAASVRSASGAGSRRSTPTTSARKKAANKSSLSRVKKASARISPASADSDLSDAGSTSDNDEERAADRHSGAQPASDSRDADEEILPDAEDEDASDDRRYCLCQNVSFGDMVACDNDNCPYEWFHWSCVGLKSEPTGTWYCPVCTEKFQKDGK